MRRTARRQEPPRGDSDLPEDDLDGPVSLG